jgi:hypothetical protein
VAVKGTEITIDTAELQEFSRKLREFLPPRQSALVMAAAVRKAIQPVTRALRTTTPIGPTGNLKRAVTSKVVEYQNSGVAVGIVGYRRAATEKSDSAAGGTVRTGPDRAFHQWWLEYGAKNRTIKTFSNKQYDRYSPTTPFLRRRRVRGRDGEKIVEEIVRGRGVLHQVSGQNAYIASSFRELGPFKFDTQQKPRVVTNPPYPRAFFIKSKDPITLPPMPIGGLTGKPPLQTAWSQTQGQVASTLQQELGKLVSEAWSRLRGDAA